MNLHVLIDSSRLTKGFATNFTLVGLSTIVSVHMFIQHLLPGEGFVTVIAEEVPRVHVACHVLLETTFGEKFRPTIDAVKLLHSSVPLHMKAQLILLSKPSSTQFTEISFFCQDAWLDGTAELRFGRKFPTYCAAGRPLTCVPPHVNLQRLLFSEPAISLVTGPGLYSRVGLYVALEVAFGG